MYGNDRACGWYCIIISFYYYLFLFRLFFVPFFCYSFLYYYDYRCTYNSHLLLNLPYRDVFRGELISRYITRRNDQWDTQNTIICERIYVLYEVERSITLNKASKVLYKIIRIRTFIYFLIFSSFFSLYNDHIHNLSLLIVSTVV